MKNLLIILFSIFYFLFSPVVFAARLAPKSAPLQPFPNSTVTPNLSQNINTTGNANNLNEQQSQQQIIPPAVQGSVPAVNSPSPKPAANPVVENIPANQSVWLYWFLLIVGVLGFGGILLRIYFRFRK